MGPGATAACCRTSPGPTSHTAQPTSAPSIAEVAALPAQGGIDTVGLHFDVSLNLNFAIQALRLIVELDDRAIIDEFFAVEDQHTFVLSRPARL